jgi:hypothetical protein
MPADWDYRGSNSLATKFGVASGIGAAYAPGLPAKTGAETVTKMEDISVTVGDRLPSATNYLIALLIIIVVMRVIGDSPRTSIEGAHIHVGGYNVLTILAITWFGTVFAKMVFNRWQVRGLTDLINAI